MTKIIYVDSCVVCQFHNDNRCFEIMCKPIGRIIDKYPTIPSWCPLPNKQEKGDAK